MRRSQSLADPSEPQVAIIPSEYGVRAEIEACSVGKEPRGWIVDGLKRDICEVEVVQTNGEESGEERLVGERWYMKVSGGEMTGYRGRELTLLILMVMLVFCLFEGGSEGAEKRCGLGSGNFLRSSRADKEKRFDRAEAVKKACAGPDKCSSDADIMTLIHS